MAQNSKDTRVVEGSWDLGLYKWKTEVDGLKLLVEGLKEKKLLGMKCHLCGTVCVPGVDYCRKCFVDIEKVVQVETTGKIMTFTMNVADIRGNPLDQPQVNCCFKLDGADSWMMGTLRIDDWKKVRIGMPVKIHFREEATGEIADIEYFELLED